MQRVTITLDSDLIEELDRFMAARQYDNRSEAIRDLVRAGLSEVSTGEGADRPVSPPWSMSSIIIAATWPIA